MPIKRKWQITLIAVSVLAVLLNTILLNFYVERNFNEFVKSNYDSNVKEIMDYVEVAMADDKYDLLQMSVELKTHLDEPISEIAVYDDDNHNILTVEVEQDTMGIDMMRRMLASSQQVDDYTVDVNGSSIRVLITRNSDLRDTSVSVAFKSQLVKNGILSIFLVILFSAFIAYWVSKSVSKDLMETAKMANQINAESEMKEPVNSRINEINIINDSLINLRYRLMLKQKGRKEKIDSLVHQTRTPLMILKSTIEGAKDNIFKLDGKRIDIMENQIENMESIIRNMSNLIEAGESLKKVDLKMIDLKKELNQIISGLSMAMVHKNIDIVMSYSGMSHFLTDQYLLKQAVYNILNNAYLYTKSHGKINVDVKVENESVSISISDTGIGMTPLQTSRIFDAYYKADSTGLHSEGLGLFIAKQNIELLGGEILVDSQFGIGSTFTVKLGKMIFRGEE